MTHRHTIRRVTLEVQVAGTEEGRRIQEVLGDLFRQRLSGILDRHLTAAGGPGLDRIDRLELDLGQIDPADLENELASRLETQLSAALGRALHAARMRDDTAGDMNDGTA